MRGVLDIHRAGTMPEWFLNAQQNISPYHAHLILAGQRPEDRAMNGRESARR